MPSCPHCGQPVAATDTRCPHCGGALATAFAAADDASDSTLLRADATRAPETTPNADDRTLIPGFEAAPAARDTASDQTLTRAAEPSIPPAATTRSAFAPVETPSPATTAGDDDGETVTCAVCGTEHEPADACPVCGALRTPVPCDEHPDRTAHSRCVLCGRAVCERDADEGRRPTTCPEHRSVPVIEGWAQVFSTATVVEAQLLAENLKSEGIDSTIYDQADRIFPVDLGELSIVRLMVPVWEYGTALQLIRGYMDGQGEVAFACAECGEVNEPEQETCTGCGARLGE